MKKLNRPETLREAQRFEQYNREARRQGLCTRCSAQASYGRQLGWSNVHPPCPNCARLVASFPVEQGNGWKTWPLKRLRGSSPAVSAPPRTPGTLVVLAADEEAHSDAEAAA